MAAMLSPRPLAVSSLASLGLAAILGFSREARADGIMIIDVPKKISADIFVDELRVTAQGVLIVKSQRDKGTGAIHIRARKITVAKGGKITATAAGYTGVNNADGSAAPSSGGGGKRSLMVNQPGGGGGYLNAGASGADGACAPLGGSEGGKGFATPTVTTPIFGSAGGAANSTNMGNAGGDGGGVIILEAAAIVIDGTVEAEGEMGKVVSSVAAGGGSGGFIAVTTASLSGVGTISAAGGDGPSSAGAGMIPPNNGGGGAGGVVFLQTRMITQALKDMVHVEGGATGSCAALTAAVGKLDVGPEDPAFCVDVDGDGAFAHECQGTDCDDSEAAIHPDAKEICNAVDDNCDGTINEGATLCAAGTLCDPTLLKCVGVPDAGADSGPPVDVGARPDHLAFESGCALGDGDGGGLGALATVTLGLGVLATRRRRAAPRAATTPGDELVTPAPGHDARISGRASRSPCPAPKPG